MGHGKAVALETWPVVLFFKFVMILHGHDDDSREENEIGPSERAKSEILRDESGGGHKQNADPDTKKPDQADIVSGFPLDDPHDKRNIEKRQEYPSPSTDLVKYFHEGSF